MTKQTLLGGMRSQRVAVTGASGFIGRHLLRALHEAGAEITAVTIDGTPAEYLDSPPFPVERVAVDHVQNIGDGIRKAVPRYVIHLNGYISMERSVASVAKTLEWNLLSTISLLRACSEVGVERVVMMGSCEEYGQKISPFDPALAPDPNSPYGASKAAATAYARMFYGSFQLPTVVLRPSVVYGPGQSARMLIPMVMKALAENRTIDVTEGRQTRDFVFVGDVVDAIQIALEAPDIVGDVWNIGSGEIVTVRECIEEIEHVTGLTGLVHYGARPYVDREIFHYEPMVENTYQAFGWRPAITLNKGLQITWDSITKQPDASFRTT